MQLGHTMGGLSGSRGTHSCSQRSQMKTVIIFFTMAIAYPVAPVGPRFTAFEPSTLFAQNTGSTPSS